MEESTSPAALVDACDQERSASWTQQEPASRRSRSFALLSPCGHGNLGDAAIQDAVIANIRKRYGPARIYGITLRPSDTEARHAIPSFPIGSFSTLGYLVVPQELGSASPRREATRDGPEPARTTSRKSLLASAVRACAGAVRTLLPEGWPWKIRAEIEHIAGALRLLKRVDTLVLSGGGQLDDYWGGALGHPYALLKWTLLSSVTKTRVLVLGVGFGSLSSACSRAFVRRALSLASYRSYRDVGSKALMSRAGFREDDPVCPDLAFSLPVDPPDPETRRQTGARRVGISPMIYCDPQTWPTKDRARYEAYLDKLAAAGRELIRQGWQIVLLWSDGPDLRSVAEVRRRLDSLLGQASEKSVHTPRALSVAEFVAEAAALDVLVASRLHGVILSHLVGTPVVALSYDRKVEVEMTSVGQTANLLSIERFTPEEIVESVRRLSSSRDEAAASILRRVAEFRECLDAQYDDVL